MKAITCKSGWIVKCHEHDWHIIPGPNPHANWTFAAPEGKPAPTLECPSFIPSVRHHDAPIEGNQKPTRCHYTITEGEIQYHSDCPHKFAGKKLPLLEFSQEEIARFNGPGYQE